MSISPTNPLRAPPTGYRTASMRSWPEGARSVTEAPAIPIVDLTPRLARQSKPRARDTSLFDKSLPGFGLRIHPSVRKVRIVQARIEGRSRRIVIARHGEMDLAQARRRVRDMLDNMLAGAQGLDARHRTHDMFAHIRAGGNPADDIRREKEARTLRAFAEDYLRRCEPHWKPSGRRTVRIYRKARILPAFGRMPVDRVGPEDVAAWFDAASRDKPGAANRALEILRAMMFRAEEWGLHERGTNPCLGTARNRRNSVARFLDAEELARLGRALGLHQDRSPEAVAASPGESLLRRSCEALVFALHTPAWVSGEWRGEMEECSWVCAGGAEPPRSSGRAMRGPSCG